MARGKVRIMAESLTERDRAMLELERKWWKYPGAKEAHVREAFGLSMGRYYQVLNALIDRPEALAYDAQTVNKLLRLRETRRSQHSARRLGFTV